MIRRVKKTPWKETRSPPLQRFECLSPPSYPPPLTTSSFMPSLLLLHTAGEHPRCAGSARVVPRLAVPAGAQSGPPSPPKLPRDGHEGADEHGAQLCLGPAAGGRAHQQSSAKVDRDGIVRGGVIHSVYGVHRGGDGQCTMLSPRVLASVVSPSCAPYTVYIVHSTQYTALYSYNFEHIFCITIVTTPATKQYHVMVRAQPLVPVLLTPLLRTTHLQLSRYEVLRPRPSHHGVILL